MEFRILGPVEVWDGGRDVTPAAAKVRALLARLLLDANRIVSSDVLVDDLWDERPPATATKTLQVYVSQLRKTIGADRVETRGGGYVLRAAPEELDAAEFEQLVLDGRPRDALELWRGPALAGLDERFARTAAASLEEQRIAALEQRIDDDLDSGRHRDVVPELERLVRAHPLRERPRAQLMLALYRSGRQADALAVYRDARAVLSDELGLEPGDELRELEQAILRHDASLRHERRRHPVETARRRRWRPLLLLVPFVVAGAYLAARDDRSTPGPERGVRTFVLKVENLLEQAHDGRVAVRRIVQAAVRCELPLRTAAAEIEDVRTNRQSLLQQVAALDVPDEPRAARVASDLQRALAAAFAADVGYRRDFLRANACPPALRPGPGVRSHRLKERFVSEFNPLAKRFGQPTWSADDL